MISYYSFDIIQFRPPDLSTIHYVFVFLLDNQGILRLLSGDDVITGRQYYYIITSSSFINLSVIAGAGDYV